MTRVSKPLAATSPSQDFDHRGVGFFRADDDRLADHAGLRRSRVLPDRQGIHRFAGDTETFVVVEQVVVKDKWKREWVSGSAEGRIR